MNKEIIAKSKARIKNKWFETKEDELDIALNIIDELERQCTNQQEVIDTAREYICTHLKQDMLSDFTGANYVQEYMSDPDELLNILKEK